MSHIVKKSETVSPEAVDVARMVIDYMKEVAQNVRWEVRADAWEATVYMWKFEGDKKYTVMRVVIPEYFLRMSLGDREEYLKQTVSYMAAMLGKGVFIKGEAIEPPSVGESKRAMVTRRW